MLKRKINLKGTKIWLSDDLTPREQEVQEWLERIAEKEEEKGKKVNIKYQKLIINGELFQWHELEGELISADGLKTFRSRSE